jgi:oligopeptide/dipeptide ABC transporter ATP-binding protein
VIVIAMSTTVGWMILETAGLSFLGLGSQPPQADLGSMLGEARAALITAPHTSVVPGVMIFLIVMSINLLGDGVRDALDPRLRSGALTRPRAMTMVDREAPLPPARDDTGLLDIQNLSTEFRVGPRVYKAVSDVSLSVQPGECVGIIGESGSGKSVTALSVMGLVASPPGVITGGAVRFRGRGSGPRLLCDAAPAARRPRRLHLSGPAGDAAPALSHRRPAGRGDPRASPDRPGRGAGAGGRASEGGAHSQRRRPGRCLSAQLSGGMRQRVGIAMALANDPDVIIADEPTTALDVTVQAQILALLDDLRRDRGLAIIFITHDFGVVAQLCDRVAVMYGGRIVEQGPTADVLARPRHPYTARLMACVPELGGGRRKLDAIPGLPPAVDRLPPGCAFAPRCDRAQDVCRNGAIDLRLSKAGARAALPFPGTTPLPGGRDMTALRVENLSKTFAAPRRLFGRAGPGVRAVRPLTLSVETGETLGVVGESGCGKSTLARMLVGLEEPTTGHIEIAGKALDNADPAAFGRLIQYVFQDPISSLNPRKSIRSIMEVPLRSLHGMDQAQCAARISEIFASVNLREEFLDRYPHEFSGGQAQRIGVARALAANPRIMVLDEPVSALDVSVQAQVLNLLGRAEARIRPDLCVHHPRPGCGRGGQRSHRGALFRLGGGDWAGRDDLCPRPATPIPGCWPVPPRWSGGRCARPNRRTANCPIRCGRRRAARLPGAARVPPICAAAKRRF